jgi:methyltransferase (TIGR00027 family)
VKEGRASFTARWVAACRAGAVLLPEEARLAEDPFGARFGGVPAWMTGAIAAKIVRATPALLRWILYMQVRTRVIDDALRDFVRAGGRQVMILGAGFDCRAARLADVLGDSVVYEIDHPATQARKREVIAGARSARVVYVPWDFEARRLSELPAALASEGHDRSRPTLTIWEGVTMYLTEPAIEESVAAVHALSAPGSPLVFTYFERRLLDEPDARAKVIHRFVKRIGEPFRWAWDPTDLPQWLASRHFELEQDRDAGEAAPTLLPPQWARFVPSRGRHCAIARKE